MSFFFFEMKRSKNVLKSFFMKNSDNSNLYEIVQKKKQNYTQSNKKIKRRRKKLQTPTPTPICIVSIILFQNFLFFFCSFISCCDIFVSVDHKSLSEEKKKKKMSPTKFTLQKQRRCIFGFATFSLRFCYFFFLWNKQINFFHLNQFKQKKQSKFILGKKKKL